MEWKAHTEGVFPRPAELTRRLGIARLFALVPDGGAVVLQAEIALLLPGAWLHLPHHRAHLHGLQVSIHLGTCNTISHLGKNVRRWYYSMYVFWYHTRRLRHRWRTPRVWYKWVTVIWMLQSLHLFFFTFFMLIIHSYIGKKGYAIQWCCNEFLRQINAGKSSSQSELGILHILHTYPTCTVSSVPVVTAI